MFKFIEKSEKNRNINIKLYKIYKIKIIIKDLYNMKHYLTYIYCYIKTFIEKTLILNYNYYQYIIFIVYYIIK